MKTLPIYLENGDPNVKRPLISWVFVMAFNFGYAYNIIKNQCIKNNYSDNLKSSFNIHEVDDYQCVIL